MTASPPPNCLHCEQPVEDGALFCGHCGEPIPVVSPAADPFVNRVVSQNYRIVKRLAQGGMGVVYLARHEQLGQRVAVKFLHRRFADDEELAARFFNEARSASKVAHPYAVGIFDFSRLDDGTLFIVMEYVDGTPLNELIRERSAVEPALAVSLAIKVCQVLDVAHEQHLVHRDVKPDNIMVIEGRDGDPTVKVLDFGIAKILDEEAGGGLTQTGMMFGTPEYMSPEQAGGSTVDGRSDVYALGLVLYEMLAGHPPFQGRNKLALLQRHIREAPTPIERAAASPLPRSLAALVMRALAKRPEDRPQTMAEFAEALKQIEAELGRPTGAHARPSAILTHDRSAREPGAVADDVVGVTETEYQLGSAADADEGFALGTGPVTSTDGYSLGMEDGFGDGFDEPDAFDIDEDDDGWAGERPVRDREPVRRTSSLPVMLAGLLAIIGAAFIIRAIDRDAEARLGEADGSGEPVVVIDGSGLEPVDGSGAVVAAEGSGAAEPAELDAPVREAASATAEPSRPSPSPAPRVPAAADVSEQLSAARAALSAGRLDDARASVAEALERAPEDEAAVALRRELTALDRMGAEVEALLREENCVRADEQVVAMRERWGVPVAARYYGALDACRNARRPTSPSPTPPRSVEQPTPPAPDPAPSPGRVLPPSEL